MTTVSKVQVHANPSEAYNLIVTLDNENATLRALLEQAEKALEPFAKEARPYDHANGIKFPDSMWAWDFEGVWQPSIKIGDLRLARSTLDEIRKGK
jgi:hypothetical protein